MSLTPSQLTTRIVQDLARYQRIASEDSVELSKIPRSIRDELVATFQSHPDVQKDIDSLVQFHGDEDHYFDQVDQAIEALTPPQTPEDRVKRFHIAATAAIVYLQHRVVQAFQEAPNIRMQFNKELGQAFASNIESIQRASALAAPRAHNEFLTSRAAPRVQDPPLIPPSSGSSGKSAAAAAVTRSAAVTERDIEDFLSHPQSMVGRRFDYFGISSELEEKGTWRVTCYMAPEGQDPIFHVLFEDISKDSWPFCEDEVREYLEHSTYAGSS